jgi:fluoroquinolone transport system permease protein
MRGDQMVALVGATLRAVRWDVTASAGGLVVGLLLWKHAQLQQPASALWLVRGTALLLTLGALPLLDDAAARQIAAVPLTLAWRSAIRLAGFVALVFAPVSALAAWSDLPVGSLLLESAAIVLLSSAASLLMTRSTEHSEPSTIVSLGLLPLPGVLTLLPPSFAMLVPEGPDWGAAHQRWAALVAIGVVVLALSLRDPSARAPGRRGRRSPAVGQVGGAGV